MLIKGQIKAKLKAFILTLNKVEQKDSDKAIDLFCGEIEDEVYSAIKKADIYIPIGAIIVTTVNGPATNPAPIVIKGGLK